MTDDENKDRKVVPLDQVRTAMWGKKVITPQRDGPFHEDAADRLKRGDLRNMQHAVCQACGYDWWAPVIERCPRCHQSCAKIDDQKEIGVMRV